MDVEKLDIEKICIACMNEKSSEADRCPHCGFQVSSYVPKVHQLAPFEILNGRYLLGKALGEGGFGITYIGLDLQEGKRVAIKELYVTGLLKRENTRTVLVSKTVDAREYYRECRAKFEQEARLMQRLKDRGGIAEIYDYFEENNTAYIVMEYLDGCDLLAYLQKHGGKISMKEAFELLRPVMKIVVEMHAKGVYHRDISPDNIRCMENGTMKLMDLGGAKNNYSDKTLSKVILVKHGYAPPEQYASGFKIGPWMDVYAMSATFYRCVTGRVAEDAMERVKEDKLIPPSKLNADISKEAEAVLKKGMALQCENRYLDMKELYYALKEAVYGKKLPEPGPKPGPKPGPIPKIDPNPEKKDKTILIVLITLWVVVVVIIIYLLIRFIGG